MSDMQVSRTNLISRISTITFNTNDMDNIVAQLSRSVKEDSLPLEDGLSIRPLNSFKVMGLNINNEQLVRLCIYIRRNYSLNFRIPPGKILSLSKIKIELENNTKIFSKTHLIILLYSITGKRTQPVNSGTSRTNGIRLNLREDVMRIITQTKIIKKDGKPELKFEVAISLISQKDIGVKLENLYDQIISLYKGIPIPLPAKIFIRPSSESCYYPDTGIVNIKLDDLYLDNAAHEIGHHIYDNFVSKNEELNTYWNMLYMHVLGGRRYELVDESNYIIINNIYGHPQDSPAEFFASALTVYFRHENEFSCNIESPDTPKKAMDVCAAIENYMRIFIENKPVILEINGIKNTVPFTSIAAELFDAESLLNSLEEAQNDLNPKVREQAEKIKKAFLAK